MNKITFVCCYNDKASYDTLCRTIKEQSAASTIIGIDNTSQKFTSCSSALNSVIDSIDTEFVAFVHQDIEFIRSDTVEKMLSCAFAHNKNDLFGVAGALETQDRSLKVITNVLHGKDSAPAGKSFSGIKECQTLDECLVWGYTSYFKENRFEEELCDDWHLYFAEQCLRTRTKDGKVYVCDIEVIHRSNGTISKAYAKGFYRLCRKYRKDFKTIATCCVVSSPRWPGVWLSYLFLYWTAGKNN